VVDFGLSKAFGDMGAANRVKCTPCGTRGYCAPEILQKGGAGSQVLADVLKRDIYAVGAITWAMLHGHSPTNRSLSGQRMQCSAPAQLFIHKLCYLLPHRRPSAEDALNLFWLKQRVATQKVPALRRFERGR
jgi:serine/threonine protein kinase